jgi:ribosome-binding factor A
MTSRKISRRDLRAGCAEPGAGDGLDPRLDRPDGPGRVPNRKALQVCAQVGRTLAQVLSGESGDPVLRDLVVASVVPAPNSARLLVTVARAPGADDLDPAEVLTHLGRARGRLRNEVAAAVHRRKVPDLTFRVLRHDGGGA